MQTLVRLEWRTHFNFLGESLLHLAQFQQNVNRNMAGHLLNTVQSQQKQEEL